MVVPPSRHQNKACLPTKERPSGLNSNAFEAIFCYACGSDGKDVAWMEERIVPLSPR